MVPTLGHGAPKVPDDLDVWLLAREVPEPGAAAAVLATLPPDLADWIRPSEDHDGGSLRWAGRVLHLHSGYGLKYFVQTLDDGHLAWLPEHGELSDADVQRVLDEVMDGARKGPRAPKDVAWQRFGAQLGAWYQAVHRLVPLTLVVVGRRDKGPGTARHREAVAWATRHLDELAARAEAQRAEANAWSASGWGAWVARSLLAVTPAKKRSEAQRRDLLRLIDGAGLGAEREGGQLLGAWPKRARAEVLASLLRQGHDLGPTWLASKAAHELLLDDTVWAAACASPRGLLVPYVVNQAVDRWERPKAGLDRGRWLARWAEAMAVRVAELEGRAPDDPAAAETLAAWQSVRAQLG